MRTGTALAIVALLGTSRAALADDVACIAAAEDGQKLRDDGHFLSARARFVTCGQEDCPSPVRGDCLKWLDELDKRTPTVVVAATSHGKDAPDVRVTIDGVVVSSRLDGRPIPVDPGEHRVRYETAHEEAIAETIIVREGEKDRALRVRFSPDVVPARPAPTLAYGMTGVAAAGVASFALFAILGYSNIQSCTGNPSGCDIASSKTQTLTEFVIADVSLGIAVIAAAVATWAFIKHGTVRRRAGAGFTVVF